MKRIHYIFLIAILLFSCEKPISDFQSKNFIKFFGSGYESKGNDVIELSEGGYAITGYDKVNGSAYKVFVDKIDNNGNSVWNGKTFGRDGYREEGKVIKEVTDGFLIVGTSLQEGSSITHSFILKISTSGDQVFYQEIGDPNYSIIINDMVVSGNDIYFAGQSNKTVLNKTDYYKGKLSTLDMTVKDQSKNYFPNVSNNNYQKAFFKADSLLLIGNDGNENKISLTKITPPSNFLAAPFDIVTIDNNNESVSDALLVGDQLYILSNNGLTSTKLIKLNSNWSDNTINSIVGKSVAYNEDGTLMICGESTEGGNQIINFIKVNTDGTTEYGLQTFRTFPGTVGRIIPTNDKGLILIGSTNSTYGVNIQLIKTDKDYFMLKN